MNATKEFFKYSDLYDKETILLFLKKQFGLVSFSQKSIPTQGSLTLKTQKLVKFKDDAIIIKPIFHRNNDLTLQTNKGFYKFIQ